MIRAPLNLHELVCESIIARQSNQDPASVVPVSTHLGNTVHVATARDVLYVPELGLQVLGDRCVPLEAILDEWNLPFEQSSGFHGRGERFASPFDVQKVDESVSILSNFYSSNFTHCIGELLKVTILERAGYSGRYVLTWMPGFAFDFLRLLGIDRARIREDIVEPTLFSSAKYTTALQFMNLTSCPDVILELRASLLSAVETVQSPFGKRLWLERGKNVLYPDRDLVNPDEVNACLDRYEFHRLDIGSLPLEQQIAVARDAEVIAGAHGSAFAHCMFMKPGSTVVECFSPLYINGCSFDICRILDHLYFMIADWNSQYEHYPHGNRVRVKPVQLEL